jgi:uncharacterized protein (TIGR00730 family)
MWIIEQGHNAKKDWSTFDTVRHGCYLVSMSDLPDGKPASAGWICVFCGSSMGTNLKYLAEAKLLGQQMAGGGWGLVYGGTSIGLMGATADAALSGGAEVIGVLPQALQDREIAHRGLTKLHLVGSMHERKALMASLSDAFIALPGGYGTLDEFFEIVTWAQLNIHSKPCVLINTDGYYDFLLRFLDHAVREEFVRPPNLRLVQVARDSREALQWIEEQRDNASLNQYVGAQNAGVLKP